MDKLREGDLVSIATPTGQRRGQICERHVVKGAPLTVRVRWEDGKESPLDLASLETSTFRHTPVKTSSAHHDPRRFLLTSIPKHSRGGEVGVWKGDFSAKLLEITDPELLYLVDPWTFMTDELHRTTRYGKAMSSQSQIETVYLHVKARFKEDLARGRVRLYRGTLLELSSSATELELDWIYIDGDHHYDAVLEDLHTAARVVRSGGYIYGDDYTSDGWWGDSVIRAVEDVVRTGEVELESVERMQYILRKK